MAGRQQAEAQLAERTEIAKQFVQFYYTIFDDADRSKMTQLLGLYVRLYHFKGRKLVD